MVFFAFFGVFSQPDFKLMNNMKRLLLVLAMTVCLYAVQAQELKLKEFRSDSTNAYAVQFPKLDHNHERCGVILLGLVLPEAEFCGDVIASEYKNGEWCVYMTNGANWLDIKSNQYLPLRINFKDYGIMIRSNQTYLMEVEKPADFSEEAELERLLELAKRHNITLVFGGGDDNAETGNMINDAEDDVAKGMMYEKGIGVAKNYKEAVKWYRKAAVKGDADGQYHLGYMYRYGLGVDLDYQEAVGWFLKSAKQGNTNAQYNLGLMYQNGNGVGKNDQKAVKWYRKAAENGHASAQNNLGFMYRYSKGVAQDYEEAVKWYRKAAKQGHAIAQYNLGLRYQYGHGVDQDYKEAVKWYRKAALQGDSNAQSNLGYMYYKGYGVAQDYQEAVKWYRKSAEQGNANGQSNLGLMYELGHGVDQNLQKAETWYRKAADQGNDFAKKALKRLGEE